MKTENSWERVWTKSNKFLFNGGSELNSETANYETFYRPYDPALGRFTGIDPLASSFTAVNPYQYAFNDPISLNDPNGDTPQALAAEKDFMIGDGLGRGNFVGWGNNSVYRVSSWGGYNSGGFLAGASALGMSTFGNYRMSRDSQGNSSLTKVGEIGFGGGFGSSHNGAGVPETIGHEYNMTDADLAYKAKNGDTEAAAEFAARNGNYIEFYNVESDEGNLLYLDRSFHDDFAGKGIDGGWYKVTSMSLPPTEKDYTKLTPGQRIVRLLMAIKDNNMAEKSDYRLSMGDIFENYPQKDWGQSDRFRRNIKFFGESIEIYVEFNLDKDFQNFNSKFPKDSDVIRYNGDFRSYSFKDSDYTKSHFSKQTLLIQIPLGVSKVFNDFMNFR